MGIYVKDGIWWYSFKLKGQERIQKSTEIKDDGRLGTKQTAEELYQDARSNFVRGKNLKFPSSISVENMFDRILELYYPNPTQVDLLSINYFKEYFQGKKATEITKEDILKFYYSRIKEGNKGKGCSPVTVLRNLSPIHRFFNIAMDNDEWNITQNPVARAKKYIKVNLAEYTRDRTATIEELKQLYYYLSPLMRDVLVFAVYTGVRRGDIINLLWSKVDFENRRIVFMAKDTKERKKRTIPIKDRVLALLKSRPRLGEYVFCTDDGKQLSKNGLIRTEWDRVKAKLGIKDLHLHDLRHTFGTRFVNSTGDTSALSRLLGHSNIETTDSIYVNSDIDHLQMRVNEMPDFMAFIDDKTSQPCYAPATIGTPDLDDSKKQLVAIDNQ